MNKEEKREIRSFVGAVTLTTEEEKRTVEGYAMLFGVASDGLYWTETIEKGALDGVIPESDVFAYLDHDEYRGVLARSKFGKGSLQLKVDERGLLYTFESPKTGVGEELLEHLRRGEIEESSFAFTVEKDEWELIDEDKDLWKRTIKKIKRLYDVSPVFNGAYSKTSVGIRKSSNEDAKALLDKVKDEYREKKEKELETVTAVEESYYRDLEDKYKL